MNHIKLYRHPLSGHSHRAPMLEESVLPIDELVDVDLTSGEHKQDAFLALNRFGQVPVLTDGDSVIADSNAILVYLATRYDPARGWLPTDPVVAAEVQRFLSIAAGPVSYGPAAARLVNVFNAALDHQQAIEVAHNLFRVLERHLDGRDWLAADQATIADLANYTYIVHAPEGDIALADYPNLQAWLARIEALPGFVPMQTTPVGLAA